jgi:hypothetical protein
MSIKYSEILATDEVLTAGNDDIILLAIVDGGSPTGYTTKAIKKSNLITAGGNIYDTDGTLTANRVMTMDNFSLKFDGGAAATAKDILITKDAELEFYHTDLLKAKLFADDVSDTLIIDGSLTVQSQGLSNTGLRVVANSGDLYSAIFADGLGASIVRIFENGNTEFTGKIQVNKGTFGSYGLNIDGTSTGGNAADFIGKVKIADGTEQAGYVLTSDANGVASWVAAGGSDGNGIYDVSNNGANLGATSVNMNGLTFSYVGSNQTTRIASQGYLETLGANSLIINGITPTAALNQGGVRVSNSSARGISWGFIQGRVGSDANSNQTAFYLYSNTSREGIFDLYRQNSVVGRFKAAVGGVEFSEGDFTIKGASGTTDLFFADESADVIGIGRTPQTGAKIVVVGKNTTSGQDILRLKLSNDADAFRFSNNGRFGINVTTEPDSMMEIKNQSSLNTAHFWQQNNAYDNLIKINTPTANKYSSVDFYNDIGNQFSIGLRGSTYATFAGRPVISYNTDIALVNGVTEQIKLTTTGDVDIQGVFKVAGTSGLSGTYTFGGGTSGDIATMTFTGGILTAVTTVP